MNDFGNFLKELRGKKSIREVAKGTGISHTYLSTLEKGFDPRTLKPRKPHPDVIKKLASYYDIPIIDLSIRAGYVDFEEYYEMVKPSINDLLRTSKNKQKNSTIQSKKGDDLFEILNIDNDLYFKDKKLSLIDKKKIITLIETILN